MQTCSRQVIKYTIGLRISPEEEILGPDLVDHDLEHEYNGELMRAFRAYFYKATNEQRSDSFNISLVKPRKQRQRRIIIERF